MAGASIDTTNGDSSPAPSFRKSTFARELVTNVPMRSNRNTTADRFWIGSPATGFRTSPETASLSFWRWWLSDTSSSGEFGPTAAALLPRGPDIIHTRLPDSTANNAIAANASVF